MADILIYSSAFCPYCVAAKNFLKARGHEYRELRIDTDSEARQTMISKTQRTSVPQIFINDTHIGGFDDMVALDRAGNLQPLLEKAL
jgi:glutaredoxin 3